MEARYLLNYLVNVYFPILIFIHHNEDLLMNSDWWRVLTGNVNHCDIGASKSICEMVLSTWPTDLTCLLHISSSAGRPRTKTPLGGIHSASSVYSAIRACKSCVFLASANFVISARTPASRRPCWSWPVPCVTQEAMTNKGNRGVFAYVWVPSCGDTTTPTRSSRTRPWQANVWCDDD